MNNLLTFSEEQTLLLDTAMEFCSRHASIDKVREMIATDEPTVERWQEMVELGWAGITIPESYGGLGLSLSHVVPIIESMGRRLMPSPLYTTTLATQALISSANDLQKQHWLPQIAAGTIATLALYEAEGQWPLENISAVGEIEDNILHLSGKKQMVLDADSAALIIVTVCIDGKATLICLDKTLIPSANLKREIVIDETRRSFELSLDGISIATSNIMPETDLASINQAALLLLSAEMCGGIAGTLATIKTYLNTRKQFDRLIGSYQALKHPTVDILLSLEATRAHVYHAASLYEQIATNGINDSIVTDLAIALSSCKAIASESFAYAGDRAVQFHGGFGFTYECDAQLYLRRAIWSQYQYGDERFHRQKLATLFFDSVASV